MCLYKFRKRAVTWLSSVRNAQNTTHNSTSKQTRRSRSSSLLHHFRHETELLLHDNNAIYIGISDHADCESETGFDQWPTTHCLCLLLHSAPSCHSSRCLTTSD